MAIFNPDEARRFASGLGMIEAPQVSFRSWINSPSFPSRFQEGDVNFNTFRELSLREVERLLLLSASNYRRSYDLLSDASASWAFVTLYYGSYFAASALLGMFGAWKLRKGPKIFEPVATTSGVQRFEMAYRVSSYQGSHQKFWEFFYVNASLLKPYIEAKHHFALNPISGDVIWPIRNRNDLNYDSFAALELASMHQTTFNATGFPSSLPGVVSTQFRFSESLLGVAGACAQMIGIETAALSRLSSRPSRVLRVEDLVLSRRPPKLGNRVKRRIASTAGD
ncbi:MAG: hypothetical protein ACTHJG_05700 [Rhodanobacteraceae bacterium]